MKKLLLLLGMIASYHSYAQYYWNFNSLTATSTNNSAPNVSISAVSLHNNNGTTSLLTPGGSSGYDGASGGSAAAAAAKIGGFHRDNSTYFEITITPSAGNSVVLSGISFGSKSSGIGPLNWTLRTNMNSSNGIFGEDYASGTLNTNTWEREHATFSLVGVADQAITLRLYVFNFSTTPAQNEINWLVDDLKLHTDVQTLPIKLKTFIAKSSISSIGLNWSTETEKNSAAFDILRSSDGKSFTTIGTVESAGNSTSLKSYYFTDFHPAPGTNYYKLLQKDLSGKNAESFIVSAVSGVKSTEISLSSLNGALQFTIYSANSTSGQLLLSNMSGVSLANQSITLDKGYNTITIEGNYEGSLLIASLKTSSESISKKFFVK